MENSAKGAFRRVAARVSLVRAPHLRFSNADFQWSWRAAHNAKTRNRKRCGSARL